ncbi:MAG: type IV pilus assembly protein PilM [bacterium]
MALPKFFGLDIGNSSIKIAQIKDPTSKTPKLVKIGSIETPPSTYGNSDEASKKKLAEAIKELVDQLGLDTKNAVTAVSERDVFSTRIKISYTDEKDLEESAYWEISRVMPVPIDTVNYGYLPISLTEEGGKKEMEALVISIEKTISDQYAEIVELAGLNPIALETEGVAIVRASSRALPAENMQGSLIIDMGSNSTSVCVVKGQSIVYSTSIQSGSEVITRSISQAFSLDVVQSEEYKKTYGVDEKYFEGKIANVIKPVLDTIILDINRAIQFFRQENPDSNITSIKLLGESSAMPGLVAYMTKSLGIAVEIIDPTMGLVTGSLNIENKQTFAVAIGLALKTDF